MNDPATVRVITVADGVARLEWPEGQPIEDVRAAIARALLGHGRVEAWVDPDDKTAQRVAIWSGLHREGVMRGVTIEGQVVDRIVYARLPSDPSAQEPEGFRALLNSFLPRKRAIGQMLIHDRDRRVLLCRLTYKQDWDLPGGVVEVGESPRLAVSREVEEELALQIRAGRLLLTDWLPPWSGWDDAICLVFDGGQHEPSITGQVIRQEREIREASFCTIEQARERCTDFTARRIEAALNNLAEGGAPAFTEAGRLVD